MINIWKYELFKRGLEKKDLRLPEGRGTIYEMNTEYFSDSENDNKKGVDYTPFEFWQYLKDYHLEKARKLDYHDQLLYLKRLPAEFEMALLDNRKTFLSQGATNDELNEIISEANFAIQEIKANIKNLERYFAEIDSNHNVVKVEDESHLFDRNDDNTPNHIIYHNACKNPCHKDYENLMVAGVILLHHFSSSYPGGKYGTIEKANSVGTLSGYSNDTIYNNIIGVIKDYQNFDSKRYKKKKRQLFLVKKQLSSEGEKDAAAKCRDWLIKIIEQAIRSIKDRASGTERLALNVEEKELADLKNETFNTEPIQVKK